MRLWKKFVMSSGKSGRLWINNTGFWTFYVESLTLEVRKIHPYIFSPGGLDVDGKSNNKGTDYNPESGKR